MKKNPLLLVMTPAVVLALALILIGTQSCKNGTNGAGEKGFLRGRVTIGPLCPVEPCDLPLEQQTRAYAARKVVIYREDARSIVKELSLDQTGKYATELNPGNYVVDINRLGIDSSGDVPKAIRIEPGQTVELNIDIDTGIR